MPFTELHPKCRSERSPKLTPLLCRCQQLTHGLPVAALSCRKPPERPTGAQLTETATCLSIRVSHQRRCLRCYLPPAPPAQRRSHHPRAPRKGVSATATRHCRWHISNSSSAYATVQLQQGHKIVVSGSAATLLFRRGGPRSCCPAVSADGDNWTTIMQSLAVHSHVRPRVNPVPGFLLAFSLAPGRPEWFQANILAGNTSQSLSLLFTVTKRNARSEAIAHGSSRDCGCNYLVVVCQRCRRKRSNIADILSDRALSHNFRSSRIAKSCDTPRCDQRGLGTVAGESATFCALPSTLLNPLSACLSSLGPTLCCLSEA